jgi:hypothetical protein
MTRRTLWTATLLLALTSSAIAQESDIFSDTAKVETWMEKLAETREVVDRVVVCFDEASFLREISKWDETRFWPVLLWDSTLVPKFVEAFEPKQTLLAEYAKKNDVSLETALKTVAAAWGAEPSDTTAAAFRDILKGRKRTPNGVVLIADGSPELLGGIALAAGRFHLPLVHATKENHAKRVTFEAKEALRKELTEKLGKLGITFVEKLDDLDFVTVANDMPFGYTLSDPDAHPGSYTIDDAIARNDDNTRWGWVGRLAGGPTRSVYMAMGALFLQPKSGMFWSRYNPKNKVFGVFDPPAALDTFRELFPTETIRHPDTTLAKWREVQWPRGNRFGFVYVNSSGGATSWSTSKGGATHFDVPDSVATVVHYTHSGSAGRPFDVDTIAGRWMANGAYVYFGSHAEPYLQSFIPPKVLAERVKAGIPLGAAMRQLLSPRLAGRRNMKVGGVDKVVTFDMSAPWKLAYFGDPSYRLAKAAGDRADPGEAGKGYFRSVRGFKNARRPTSETKQRHALDAIGTVRLDPTAKKLVDSVGWSKVARSLPSGDAAARGLEEMTRVWVASLLTTAPALLYDPKEQKKLKKVPAAITKLVDSGADSTGAARVFSEFAKGYVAGLPAHPESGVGKTPALARWVLETACCFAPSKGAHKPFFTWVKEAAKAIGVERDDLRKATLGNKWITAATRKTVPKDLAPDPKKPAKKGK